MNDSSLVAYWRFFELFNTRDAYSFASAMSYPHVRVSWARPAVVLADHEAHALTLSWDAFIKAGWDHTVGSEPELLASSSDKAHIKGGWTRFTEAGEPLLTNEVSYIATLVEDRWGIQSRFGTDSRADRSSDQVVPEAEVFELIERFLTNLVTDRRDLLSATTTDEFFNIGVGAVDRFRYDEIPISLGMEAPSLRLIQSGAHAMTVNAKAANTEALIYAVESNGKWRVKAGSWL